MQLILLYFRMIQPSIYTKAVCLYYYHPVYQLASPQLVNHHINGFAVGSSSFRRNSQCLGLYMHIGGTNAILMLFEDKKQHLWGSPCQILLLI